MLFLANCATSGARARQAQSPDRLPTQVWSWPAAKHIYDVGTMADEAPPVSPQTPPPASDAGSFLESLMDTELYSIGAFFCDEHPDLVDEVVARSEDIERRGLETYSRDSGGPIEESFETLLTGLAVRYYKAVAG